MKDERAQNKGKIKKFVISGALVAGIVALPSFTYAVSNSANTIVTATISSVISISTSGTVALAITPVSGGAQTSAKDVVTVSTNNVLGYNLTLADSDATTTLVKGSDTITAHAGTQTTPTALANNSWGYHVDGIGGFGTGGAVETNVTTSTIKYAGVPATGSANNIKSTSSTASADTTDVWYAAKADTSKPNGAYSDTVTYTATTKP